ncbi:FHA domain-containing protein [Chitinophaga sp. Cy-1792]|uniref:FHA domain-containing protein n=1 Tax=Chitinophaga sp. Cy-1792 TaxID=2608339 RepID=UPI0014242388|nr:FHA domain-containing protein [Chitinophaga sp. Cy-1792]NIG56640.1 FHA domain-containing protein [Chitinophaga sp. Cy-1792]
MNNRFIIVCPKCQQDNGFDKLSNRPAACKNCGAALADSLPAEKQKTPVGIIITNQESNDNFILKFFELAFFGREHMGKTLFRPHVEISRRHFLIKLSKNQYYIQDLGSMAGTFFELDGTQTDCKEPVPLVDGGTIILGKDRFTVNIQY